MSDNKYVTTSYEFPVRASYFYGIVPQIKTNKDTGEKRTVYSSSFLIPKEDKVTNAAIQAVFKAQIDEKWPNGIPKSAKITYRDGDVDGKQAVAKEIAGYKLRGVPDSAEAGEEPYGGHYLLNTKEETSPPKIIGPAGVVLKEHEIPTDLIVSGDYVVARVKAFTWGPTTFGTGVSWELVSVQLVKKGEALGGDSDAGTAGFKPIETSDNKDPLGVM